MSTTPADLRAAAEGVIDSVNHNLEKWQTWFPNSKSDVEIPREDLLALVHFAKIGLAEHHADDDEPVTVEKLVAMGATVRKTTLGTSYFVVIPSLVYFIPSRNQWSINGAIVDGYNPKMGQLRHLLAGLQMGDGT